jgi:ribosome biogenesis GTPase
VARNRKRQSRKSEHLRLATNAGDVLPSLSSLEHIPAYDQLRASLRQKEHYQEIVCALSREGIPASELHLGCVVRLDRGYPAVVSDNGLCRAEFAARFTKGSSCDQLSTSIAIGDWVCVRMTAGHAQAQIEALVPRKNAISRWRGGNRGQRQVLAANIDSVLIAQPLGARLFDFDRVMRSAVIARDCGASVAVVLTKADRVSEEAADQTLERLKKILGVSIPFVVCSSGVARSSNISRLMASKEKSWASALVPVGTVAIVLGQSGAGKSTLLNAFLGQNTLAVGAVRPSDDAGRHTTVSRRMVALPGAGIIVDEPGLRSLPLVGHERGLALVFPKIDEAAHGCRFRNCTHTSEPGCAVRAALSRGEFSPESLEAYLRLASEMRLSASALDPDVTL